MPDTPYAWIVDDDNSIRWVLQKALEAEDIRVKTFDNAEPVLPLLESDHPDAIITDVRMPGMDGLQLLDRLSTEHPEIPVIIMTTLMMVSSVKLIRTPERKQAIRLFVLSNLFLALVLAAVMTIWSMIIYLRAAWPFIANDQTE